MTAPLLCAKCGQLPRAWSLTVCKACAQAGVATCTATRTLGDRAMQGLAFGIARAMLSPEPKTLQDTMVAAIGGALEGVDARWCDRCEIVSIRADLSAPQACNQCGDDLSNAATFDTDRLHSLIPKVVKP